MNEQEAFKYEKYYKDKPHVVILGAGASVATILKGDKNGRKISAMDGFLKNLGMSDIIENLNLKTKSQNLEDIYSELSEDDKYKDIRNELDDRIRTDFNKFEISNYPTIYDMLLLSLRKKDLVATFNWDPLLLQAYQRVVKITDNLPQLAFLHGNVLVGYCEKDKRGGLLTDNCQICQKKFIPSRLLYPVKKKNYNQDTYTYSQWKTLKSYLKNAYQVTIFGYSAPKTDIEAIDMLKEAWGNIDDRSMEEFEFIDIAKENHLIKTWKDFVHTHHYTYSNNFFDSTLAKFPRRTIESLFDRTQNCLWLSSENPFKENMSFIELTQIVNKLILEEENNKNKFITLKNGI